MNVAGHDTISINLHSLILPAKVQASQDRFEVYFSNKNIYPIDGSKTDEVKSFFVVEFVLSAHLSNITAQVQKCTQDKDVNNRLQKTKEHELHRLNNSKM
jgi:hypothetical protein